MFFTPNKNKNINNKSERTEQKYDIIYQIDKKNKHCNITNTITLEFRLWATQYMDVYNKPSRYVFCTLISTCSIISTRHHSHSQ